MGSQNVGHYWATELNWTEDRRQLLLYYKVKVKVAQLCPTLCDTMDCHGIIQIRILEWVAFPLSWGSSHPRDWTQASHIAGGFFPSWAQGKPNNSGVGSLSLLQKIFPTQECNWDLLHYRQILYQLSYQGSLQSEAQSTMRCQIRMACLHVGVNWKWFLYVQVIRNNSHWSVSQVGLYLIFCYLRPRATNVRKRQPRSQMDVY